MRLPKLTPASARAALVLGFVILTIMIFVIMIMRPDLAENDLFKTLSQAVIVQGLIGLAAAFYFTANDDGPPPDRRD